MKKINFISGLGFKYEVTIELGEGRPVIKEVYNKSKDLLCELVPLANGGTLANVPMGADNSMVLHYVPTNEQLGVVELIPKILGFFK